MVGRDRQPENVCRQMRAHQAACRFCKNAMPKLPCLCVCIKSKQNKKKKNKGLPYHVLVLSFIEEMLFGVHAYRCQQKNRRMALLYTMPAVAVGTVHAARSVVARASVNGP